MVKELRISATVEVPDDIWEQTDRLSDAKPIVAAFREAMEKMGGSVSVDLVTPKPRGDKGDVVAQYNALGGKMP